MRLIADYHTHTIFSHGKGKIEDNVNVAIQKGLDEIAITDHGPGHIGYGIKKKEIEIVRNTINAINDNNKNKIKVKLGVEANIVGFEGRLDIDKEILEQLDIVLAGYHFGAFYKNYVKEGIFHGKNFLFNRYGLDNNKSRVKNTEIIVKSIYNNNIDILTHPGAKISVHIREVAKACAETNTYMEINNRHGHLTVEEIKEAAKEEVKFVVSSDAHKPEDVGNVSNAIQRVKQSGIDICRVVNLVED